MKKTISIVLAIMMLVSMAAMVVAAEVVSIENTQVDVTVETAVDGQTTKDISYKFQKAGDGTTTVVFTYNGKLNVTDWEIAGIQSSAYKILSKDDGSITLQLLDADAAKNIKVNAVTTKGASGKDKPVPSGHGSKTSPATGK